jgi:hypothetical protein
MSGWTVLAYLIAGKARKGSLLLGDSQPFRHFLVKEPFSQTVGLDPFAIDHKLRDGAFARVFHNFVCGAGRTLNVDFLEKQIVFFQEALGLAAVGAPGGRVNGDFHCLVSVLDPALNWLFLMPVSQSP